MPVRDGQQERREQLPWAGESGVHPGVKGKCDLDPSSLSISLLTPTLHAHDTNEASHDG